jgi:hypothetical protein
MPAQPSSPITCCAPTYLIRFLLRIRGALTAAPTKLDPVSQIPHAAPTMLSPSPNATPKFAYPYGLMCVSTSAHPALQYSELQVADDDDMAAAAVFVVSDCFAAAAAASSSSSSQGQFLSQVQLRALYSPTSNKNDGADWQRGQTQRRQLGRRNKQRKGLWFCPPGRTFCGAVSWQGQSSVSTPEDRNLANPSASSLFGLSVIHHHVSGDETPQTRHWSRLSIVASCTVVRRVEFSSVVDGYDEAVNNDLACCFGRTTSKRPALRCTFEGLACFLYTIVVESLRQNRYCHRRVHFFPRVVLLVGAIRGSGRTFT